MKTLSCLLIDDDIDDREFFSLAVSEMKEGVECLLASGGHEAFEILAGAENLPDYIFLDINMPRMSGIECLQLLKADERLKSIPVIMYSTSSDNEIKRRTEQLGAHSFMTKPVRLQNLKDGLARVFVSVALVAAK